MKIMLELSERRTRVDRFLANTLPEQILAGRVLDALAPDLAMFEQAVRRAYRSAGHRSREPRLRVLSTKSRQGV
jgi:hypothetical protein